MVGLLLIDIAERDDDVGDADVLEFRNATRFNLVYGVNDETRWQRIADTYRDRAELWANEIVPPSDRSEGPESKQHGKL